MLLKICKESTVCTKNAPLVVYVANNTTPADDAIEQSTDWLFKVNDKHLDHLEKWVNEAIEKWFDLHPQYKPQWFLVDIKRVEEVREYEVHQ